MTDPLREAAQAVVRAWGPSGGPEWDWMNRRIDRLRDALAQYHSAAAPSTTQPHSDASLDKCGECRRPLVCPDCEGWTHDD